MGFDDGEDEEMSSRTFVSQSRKFEVPSLPPLSPPRTGQSEASRRLGVLKNRTQSSANLIFCSPESSRLSHISSASKIARAMRYPWRSSSPPSSWSPYTTTTVFPDWITQSEEWKKMNGLMRRRDLMDAFQKPNHLRDHTQIMLISEWLKAHWSTAAHLGQRRCIALAKNVQYLTVKRDMEIITEGERGYTFYIMISGEVIIHKKGCGNISTLGSGSYFGERALNTTTGYDLRQASVISNADPCKLLVLHKSDYDTILRNYQESIRAEAFQVLKSVPLFSKWSRSRLERICAMLERKEYKPSTVIFRQGDLPDNIYFIIDGSVEVIKEITIRTKNRWPVAGLERHEEKVRRFVNRFKILDLGPGKYFGEIAIVNNSTRAATIQTTSQSTILALDKFDFLDLLHRGHTMANVYQQSNEYPSDDDILGLFSSLQEKKQVSKNIRDGGRKAPHIVKKSGKRKENEVKNKKLLLQRSSALK